MALETSNKIKLTDDDFVITDASHELHFLEHSTITLIDGKDEDPVKLKAQILSNQEIVKKIIECIEIGGHDTVGWVYEDIKEILKKHEVN